MQQSIDPHEIFVIVNPVAGGGRGYRAWPAIRPALRTAGRSVASGPAVERWLARQRLSTHLLLALAVPLALFLTHPVKGTASQTGALAGVGIGLALTRRYVSFAAGGPVWQRALRFLTGGVFAVALYLGFRILRYGLVGLWIGVGAPWLFQQLRLVPAGGRRA